jgi:cobalt/nickel transport system permease protein
VHHVIVERWSRKRSWLHARDARAKVVAALALIVAIATSPQHHHRGAAGYALVAIGLTLIARLPLLRIAARAGLVLPFSAAFAIASFLAGDVSRATALVWKSYLSAFTVLLLVSTTPLVDLLRALEWFRVPGLLILIAQFLYRYLFVISEQAQHMRLAAQCRAGGRRSATFRGTASALSVLFVRSYARADGIQRAMLARGFRGHFPALSLAGFDSTDAVFCILAVAACAAIRIAA